MLSKIRCLIIDDEAKAIEVLLERLSILFPELTITGTYTEWKKGLEALRTTEVDLLFMDMSMPEKSGIDVLRLFPTIPFQVIFITAHSEFAVDAIKLSAAGYVLKPIDDYELSFAVNKAIENIRGKASPVAAMLTGNALKIGIPNSKGVDYIKTDDILYFESINKYTKVVTMEYSILSSYNLGEFRKLLDSMLFYPVHRSYIINLNRIKRYETTGMLIMEDNMQIPVSKNVRTDFMNVFGKISKTAGLKDKDNQ